MSLLFWSELLALLPILSTAELTCNGFEYSAAEGERDAIPTGVCIDFGSFSSYYQCSMNDTITRINFDSTDCSGHSTWIDDVCAYDSSIQTAYAECTEYCNLEPCNYVLQSTYYEANTCDEGYQSGKSPWTLNSLIQDYCSVNPTGSQSWTCNTTHSIVTAYGTNDCSAAGSPQYTVPIPVGDSCQPVSTWVNAYNTDCGQASEYIYDSPTSHPTPSPVDGTVTIYITRDVEPVGDALLGTFECDGLTGYTLENDAAKIDTGVFRAFLYESRKFNRTVIFLNDEDTGRSAIEIHAGNYASNTVGCILVGDSRGTESGTGNGAIWKSVITLDALIEKCQDKSIVIEIVRETESTTNSPSWDPTNHPMNDLTNDPTNDPTTSSIPGEGNGTRRNDQSLCNLFVVFIFAFFVCK